MSGVAGEMAGRLIVGLDAPALGADERRWLAHWRPAGVILFARNCGTPASWRRLVGDLRAVLPADSELCADHEGGPVSFLQAVAGRPPALRTLGDLDDTDLTRRVHYETGKRLRTLGLDRVLAPCCDILSESGNPVIGARAFGAEPERVCRHAAAAMTGLGEAGLKGCLKHWPGHGATRVDTHETGAEQAAQGPRPAGAAPRAAPASAIRRPFLAALAAGADALMIGHLPVAAGRPPLTLDSAELAALRRRLGAAVRLYSDDVSMGALRAPLAERGIESPDGLERGLVDPAGLPAGWLLALAAAGCDRLLLRGIPWRALPLPGMVSGPVAGHEAPADAANAAPPAATPPAVVIDLLDTGPPAAVYTEARHRAGRAVALRHGADGLLWFDTTGADRLGPAGALLGAAQAWWPQAVYLEAGAEMPPSSQGPFARLLVTAHRPLTVGQARQLGSHVAQEGIALAAGHPSLADDLRRLLGPGWRLDALYDCAGPDLAVLGATGAPPAASAAPESASGDI